mgnify:CR=1 FL=1|tara:strand:- start:808 stop:1092 length:285 start_codon:yes stop_codon:yes gene_type:complete
MSKYDFKRKRYGWGWVPVTLRGWILTVLLAVIITAWCISVTPAFSNVPESWTPVVMIAGIIVIIVGFMRLVSSLSPPAKWRMGKNDDDNPDEDY